VKPVGGSTRNLKNLSLLFPLPRHCPRQFLELDAPLLPSINNRFLNVRRQERQAKEPIDKAAVDVLGLGQLPCRPVLPIFQ
jgi:hypothetical protein